MNSHFRRVAQICFPKVTIIADKYHVVRQVYWAMENVRKSEQKKFSDKFRKYFKHSKRLLMKPVDKLNDNEMNQLALMLEISPRLAAAYRLKMNSALSCVLNPLMKEGCGSVNGFSQPRMQICPNSAAASLPTEIGLVKSLIPWMLRGQTALSKDATTKRRF